MFVIGIAGGTGSGKTTVVKKILSKLKKDQVSFLAQDSYYKDNGHLPVRERQDINFDHPELYRLLHRSGRPTPFPLLHQYCYLIDSGYFTDLADRPIPANPASAFRWSPR